MSATNAPAAPQAAHLPSSASGSQPEAPPYSPPTPSQSPSKHVKTPRARTRPTDLEMGVMPGASARPSTEPSPAPASTSPPRYDFLASQLGDFIHGDRRPRRQQSTTAAALPPPVAAAGPRPSTTTPAAVRPTRPSRSRRSVDIPPPPAFGVKQEPDTVSRSFFYYGCESAPRVP